MQALRDQSGLSQAEFAIKIGKTQSVVSRLEDTEYGAVTVSTLLDVAKELDIALLVQFCSYTELLSRYADVSPQGLRVENIHQTLGAHARQTLGAPAHPRNTAADHTRQITITGPTNKFSYKEETWPIIQNQPQHSTNRNHHYTETCTQMDAISGLVTTT